MKKAIGWLWFGIPVLIFTLSASGFIGFSPFGMTPAPETDLDYLDNAMRAGGWLIVGWALPFVFGVILFKHSK